MSLDSSIFMNKVWQFISITFTRISLIELEFGKNYLTFLIIELTLLIIKFGETIEFFLVFFVSCSTGMGQDN